jgi:hypothetical protein
MKKYLVLLRNRKTDARARIYSIATKEHLAFWKAWDKIGKWYHIDEIYNSEPKKAIDQYYINEYNIYILVWGKYEYV